MAREKLATYRGDKTQSEIAKMYGVTQQAWSQWERGIAAPSARIMKRIEDDAHIPMEELFPDVFGNKM